MTRTSLLTLSFLVIASAAQAQLSAGLREAARSITPEDIQLRVNIIADDSMMGRDTPSPGLEKTAQYVADQFRKFGLRPGGENGSFFQRYSISQRRIDPAGSHVGFMLRGKHVHAELARDARLAFGGAPAKESRAPAVILGGGYTQADAEQLEVRGKAVVVVMDYGKPLTPVIQQAIGAVMQRGPVGVVLLSNRDSATFAQRVAAQALVRVEVGDGGAVPVVEVHERAVTGLLGEAGVRLDEIRASARAVAKPLPDLVVAFGLKDEILQDASAPNTIGVLEGSDPKLRSEYIVYSAHMDHVGTSGGGQCQARGADSICNGADDDASGTVSIVELAEAFSRKGARPKRSIIFMTVSGEEKGLWGSGYFAEHPTVPMAQVVANLNIDMVGRNWRDTIVAIGKEHSDLGATLNRVVEQHRDLNMVAIDDRWPEENFYFRSDHYNFARKGVPILFFFNGVHADYHQVSDSPDRIDSEKQARIARLLFYLGQEVGNAAGRPKWNPASYQKIVEQKPAT
jgi:hypothetical protein